MAPSAVETVIVPVPEVNPVKLQSAHHRGVYKELAPVAFDKEAELSGKKGFQAAKHSALVDWKDGQRRHLARITPQAETPYETPFQAKA